MPLILPANTLSDGAYSISNSLRFDGSSSYLRDTLGTPTSQRKLTLSAWIKGNNMRSGGDDNKVLSVGSSGDSHYTNIMNLVRTNGTPQIYISDTAGKYLNFNNTYFRDPSAWYHFVVQIDTTQSTATNRLKWYVNGEQLSNTLASHESQPDEDYDIPTLASGQSITVGGDTRANDHFFDGYIAELHFCDGQIHAPTEFGETNDNGVWVPKKADVTYGNNGFFLEFKQNGTGTDASGMGADTSGNGNHLAVTGLTSEHQTTDTPTNNFCTWNPLANYYPDSTFTEGNVYLSMKDGVATFNTGTFGLTSGKWYWETKVLGIGSGSDNFLVGVVSRSDSTGTSDYLGEPTSVVYRNNGQIKKDSSNATHGASYAVNDIVMVALDCDNNNIYFGKNGYWNDGSGNADEATPNSAVSFTSTMISDGIVFPAQGDLHSLSPSPIASTNFGNPAFTISSGNADANGYGNFEYNSAINNGYYAICTKNLAEFG